MKNVTITLDENVALWVRVLAARRNTSVSRLVGELLKQKMTQEDEYERSEREYFSQVPYFGSLSPYPKRDELYDR